MLATVSNERFKACRVEGASGSDQLDVVDFDLIGADGETLLAAQVKTGLSTTPLGTGVAYRILVELVTRCDAECYQLLTNVRLASGTTKLANLLARADLTIDDRRNELQRVLAEARSTSTATDLTDDQVERLARCRILVDQRGRTDVADSVKTQVWDFRRQYGLGIGHRSSGLLLAHLLTEVHRKAAFAEQADWTKAEVMDAIVQDERDIVELLGSRDWGSVLGLMAPVPDLPRTTQVQQIVSALDPYRPTGRSVRHCTLTGLSGIGKSSLASAYVAAYADAYSAIYWMDATSSDSIEDGFQALAGRLGIEQTGASEHLRSAVHEALSTQPGRFLLVLDDATAELARQWTPTLADADVLVTTIDSTARLGSPIAVPTLTPDEAAELLRLRLDEPTAGLDDQAQRLAVELERWPLALELAAAYLRGCGYTLADVDYYLEALKVRSLGDELSIPPGYPRTLVAAIDLGLEVLFRSNPGDTAALAAEMLQRASYLSSRRVPIQLLVAPLVLGADGLPAYDDLSSAHGPVVLEDLRPHEAVRALCRISFVRHDERLAWRSSDLLPGANHTIALNAVLQEVVRNRLEHGNRPDEWKDELQRLAMHTDHWLSAATHNHETTKAHQLAPHAATLTAHLRRLGVTGRRIAVLAGNLASTYIATGRDDEAIDLLRTELDMLLGDADGVDLFLEHQARLHLARAITNSDQAIQADPNSVVTELARVFTYAQTLALNDDTHRAATTFCVTALSILSILHDRVPATDSSNALVTVLHDLQERLPSTSLAEDVSSFEEVNRLISEGEDEEAERIARTLLTRSRHGFSVNTEIRRLLAESLAAQKKWGECRIEIDNLAGELGCPPLSRESAQQALHNIALNLVVAARLDLASPGPRLLLQHILNLPCFVHTIEISQGEYKAKFEIFSLASAAFNGNPKEIEDRLASVDTEELRKHSEQDASFSFLSREIIRFSQSILRAHERA
ncbi:ATP-binding protein [Lentzea sp. HUAS12]|uniref:ATP-binding protein n=1 Tax=Lentzea sp. HUAS12 TaxID=2951806 RepID=UPI00209D0F71|nr:ATP-binding protein [Lentzea sp. HUAS12]USX54106.1 ATP-binding protein [Lentzea sp. HUAS12]